MAGPDQPQPVPYGTVPYGIVPDPSQPGQAASYPTGQYPPAAGRYAAAPASPTGYGEPKPPRRRRTVLVVSLVVVLVLAVVAGTGAVLLLRNRVGSNDAPGSDSTASADSTDAASSGGRWSSAWLDGFEEAWTLDAPPASGKKRDMSVKVAGDKLIRTVSASKTTTVTVFQLGDGQPDQLWEEDVSGSTLWITVWKNWIVVGNTLVDIDSHEHTTAPWAENALVSSSHESAIACVDTTCTMWTSPTEKKWEAELPETTSVRVLTDSEVGGYAWAEGTGKSPNYIVDLNSGSSKKLESAKGGSSPYALADGWVVYGADRQSAAVTLYEPDGTLRETFLSNVGGPDDDYPWSPEPFTLDQARSWLKDGDTSWAPGTYSVSQTDASCESITVAGNDIDLGEDNSLTGRKRGGCSVTSTIQVIYHAGDGQIATFYEHRHQDDEVFLHLVDMATGRASDPIPLGDYSSYDVKNDVLIVHDEAGGIKAYRPA